MYLYPNILLIAQHWMMSGSLLLTALVALNTLLDRDKVVGDGNNRVSREANVEESHQNAPPLHEQPVQKVSSNRDSILMIAC